MPDAIFLPPAERQWRAAVALLWPAGMMAAPVLVALDGPPLCALRYFAGLPCPLCGGTHACAALASGAWASAWQANPGVVVLIALGALHAGLLAGEAFTGRRLPAHATVQRLLGTAWRAGGGLLLATWGIRLATLT